MSNGKTPAENMHDAMDTLGVLIDGAASYRNQLEAAGFSPPMAEQMAADWHRAFLVKVFSS